MMQNIQSCFICMNQLFFVSSKTYLLKYCLALCMPPTCLKSNVNFIWVYVIWNTSVPSPALGQNEFAHWIRWKSPFHQHTCFSYSHCTEHQNRYRFLFSPFSVCCCLFCNQWKYFLSFTTIAYLNMYSMCCIAVTFHIHLQDICTHDNIQRYRLDFP